MVAPVTASELARVEPSSTDLSRPMTITEVLRDVGLIQHVMKDVMKDGTHFGTVPGCGDAKTLFKPGAEKLASTFRLAIDPEIEDLSTEDCIRYRIRCRVLTQAGGVYLGSGVGEASTGEDKWKWRRAYQDEFDTTPADRRRKKNSRNGPILQVRTNPADLANTVLKMAKKRALVDAVLTVTAASDIFKQDLEDLPEEILADLAENEAEIREPKRKSGAPATPTEAAPTPVTPAQAGPVTITEGDRKALWALARERGVTAEAIKARLKDAYGIDSAAQLPADKLADFKGWIATQEQTQG